MDQGPRGDDDVPILRDGECPRLAFGITAGEKVDTLKATACLLWPILPSLPDKGN